MDWTILQMAENESTDADNLGQERSHAASFVSASPPFAPASSMPVGLLEHPDYAIKKELGRGGMGVVYLAHNKLLGRDEVLKVMGREIISRPGLLDRFLREMKAVAKLRHPNIVTAYSAKRIGENIVFAMEYVEGLDLSKVVKTKGPLPVSHACHFAYQAALGLEHAFEEGLVHRDIKPANLMLSRKGDKATVKVLDFGLAKVAREEKVDGGLTSEGQALGTPDFIAPEQIVNAPNVDIRADIYSLGGTLFYLLTGSPPFRANTLYEVYQAHISRDAEPLNLIRPEVPAELAALVAKMMAKDPVRRFQTPGEVAKALSPFFKKENAALKVFQDDPVYSVVPLPGSVSDQERSHMVSAGATGKPSSKVADRHHGDGVAVPSSAPTELPPQFGRYRVKKKLGGGGMGTVYLVENTELEREEALKVPHFSDGDDRQVRERFLREAKSAARLDHPNLCPIYVAGVQEGTYYLTMRFLKGRLLSDYSGKPQPQRKVVEIVTKLAQALEAAHGQGVIHRDLKPSNIMMVGGQGPVVMDFGLAKQVRQQDQTLTQAGAALGTPAYMPPEQVNGDLERMGPASDVYSLGVILYELLTGRLPFEGTMAAIYGQILYAEPPSPSALVTGLNPALDAICQKAMAKASTDRYPSMKAFAGALTEFLRSIPATAGAGSLVPNTADKAGVFQASTVAPGPLTAGKAAIFQASTVAPGPRAGGMPTLRLRTPKPVTTGPSPLAAKSRGWLNPLDIICTACVLLTIAIAIWAVAVFRVRTANGILVVEVNVPNPDVYVDGEKVTVVWQNGGKKAEVGVKPGTRKVELKKDGFRAFGEEVTLDDQSGTVLHARLEPDPATTPDNQLATADIPKPPPNENPVGSAPKPVPGDPSIPLPPEIGHAARKVYLSDLDESKWSGHEMFGKNGHSRVAAITVNGVSFPKGLWTHPPASGFSSVQYRLSGLDAAAFVTQVAINDSARPGSGSLLTFQVLGDGAVVWTSAPMRATGQTQECRINVPDVRDLELRVYCSTDPAEQAPNRPAHHGAHAVWLDPYLMVPGPRSALIEKPNRPVAEVDRLPAGSVWKGTRTYRRGGYAGNTVSYELHIQERDGAKFKGHKFDNGAHRNRLEIEGQIDGDTISWTEKLARDQQVHFRAQGKLKAAEITFDFQGAQHFIEGDGKVQRQ
jgi:serine/threonine protein kinase